MSDKAYEQARPFQEDGHLAVFDQELRAGGVLIRACGAGLFGYSPKYGKPTHRAFTIAEAEALIDPNDPVVRDRLERALCSWFTWERVQEVKANGGLERMLAALVGKP